MLRASGRSSVPAQYCYNVWYGKIRMVWLPEGERNLKTCLFVLTECMYERDRHTGRQTDRHRMTAKAACIASRSKKMVIKQQKLMLKTSIEV